MYITLNTIKRKLDKITDTKITVMQYGYNVLDVEADQATREYIYNTLKKAEVYIEIFHYSNTMRIWIKADHEKFKAFQNRKNKLHEVFNTVYHNTKNAAEAKKAQYAYALENNCINEYNMIYA